MCFNGLQVNDEGVAADVVGRFRVSKKSAIRKRSWRKRSRVMRQKETEATRKPFNLLGGIGGALKSAQKKKGEREEKRREKKNEEQPMAPLDGVARYGYVLSWFGEV